MKGRRTIGRSKGARRGGRTQLAGRSSHTDERKHRLLAQATSSHSESVAGAVVNKAGDLYFLCERDRQVPLSGDHGYGLYYHDCRYLNGYEFELQGLKPRALVGTLGRPGVGVFELTGAGVHTDKGDEIDKTGLGVHLSRVIDGEGSALRDCFRFHNLGMEPIDASFELSFRAEFEDIFAVRGHHEESAGKRRAPRWNLGELEYRYDGSDGILRCVIARFSPRPDVVEGTAATFQLRLEGRATTEVHVDIAIQESGRTQCAGPFQEPLRRSAGDIADEHEGALADRRGRQTVFQSDNRLLNEIVDRSFRDLQLLRSRLDGYEFFSAGIPWFAALFARDSLISALQMLAFDTSTAEQTLRLVARYQGTRTDEWREEQPGKILHELRVGELARTNKTPHAPYYGSIDSTPLFLMLLCRHACWTGRLDLFREMRPNIERALEWMRTDGQAGGLGYLAYDSTMREGLINQGWKDSGNAVVNEDGSLGRPPIALVEVQGYVYSALIELAGLFELDGAAARAAALRGEAEALRERFNRDYWLEDKGFYAMALQQGGDAISVISSNPGHTLWTGIADPRRAGAVVDRLMAEDMFSGWGVRCLSSRSVRYNAVGYHLGTVWPHDNSLIAAGFRRYGFDDEARRIFEGLTEAAAHFPERRLPEVFAGFAREGLGVPGRYPVACHPQAWAAAAVPYMLQALLGLEADGFRRELRVVRPVLPLQVDRLCLSGVRVGEGEADLSFDRDSEGRVGVRAEQARGPLDVVVVEGLEIPQRARKEVTHVENRR